MKKFLKNENGVLITEFMVILPVLLLWFMALIVFYDAFHKWMKFTTATYTISDLLSRQTIVEDSFIQSLDGLFDTISNSKSKDDTWLRVTSVQKNDGVISILWSVDTSHVPQPSFLASDIQDSIPNLGIDEHLLLIETYSPYIPAFDWVGLNALTLNESVATSSRFSSKLINLDHLNFDEPSDDGVDDPLE